MFKMAVFCFLGMAVPVSAIVVTDYAAAETAPSSSGLDLDWGYVYNYKGSSAVAVGGGWLLTAKHVANDPGTGALNLDGTDYLQQQIVYHSSADLALVRFDKDFPGFYELYTGYVPASLGDTKLSVLMIGYGTTGTVSSASWQSAPGWSYGGNGVKRWGSQQIDNSNGAGNEFSMYFNLSSTTYEAGAGTGDSGGGVFYREGDTWKLAGINKAIGANINGYNRIDAMSMPYYADWVAETIPEPAAVGLIGFGSIGLFLARARRQRKLSGRSLFPVRREEPLCDRFFAMDEPEAGGGKLAACVDYLMRVFSRIALFSASMERFRFGLYDFRRDFWNHVSRIYENGSLRLDTIKSAVSRRRAGGIDRFLDKISYYAFILNAWKNPSRPTHTHRISKGLDLFLDKINFDKLMRSNQQLRKSIRSAIRKVCMDYSSKDN